MSILLPYLMLNLPAYRAAEDLTVPLPHGETYLGDIGIYHVTYQSYGQESVAMPLSWTGHFTTETGISYLSSERILGRSAILLHSPWRVPPGKVWVDYLVRLPEVTPIVLSFGIAMAPDVAVPGRSDGVTFSAYLLQGDQNLELMRQHQAKAEWKDYRFNLTQYAGQVITLRLQTEPGPKNDPSWDYSYFGDAKISAGPEIRDKLLQQLLSAPAYQATEKLGMQAMANNDRQGIVPGNLLKSRNSITKSGPIYRFMYHGKDGQVVYTYRPKTGTLDDFTVQVENGRPFQPARGGGVVLLKEGEETQLLSASGGRLISAKLSPGRQSLTVRWDYDLSGTSVPIIWTFQIMGKALVVSASCSRPVASSFSLGEIGLAQKRWRSATRWTARWCRRAWRWCWVTPHDSASVTTAG